VISGSDIQRRKLRFSIAFAFRRGDLLMLRGVLRKVEALLTSCGFSSLRWDYSQRLMLVYMFTLPTHFMARKASNQSVELTATRRTFTFSDD